MKTASKSILSKILKDNLQEVESQRKSFQRYAKSSKDKLLIQSTYDHYKNFREEVFKYFDQVLKIDKSMKLRVEEVIKLGDKAPMGFGMHICMKGNTPIILGGMSHPITNNPHLSIEYLLDTLTSVGFNTLVSFTESNQELKEFLKKINKEWNHFEIPMQDFGDISLRQFDQFYSLVKEQVEKKNQVVVHCRAGCGRTGTMLASLSLREIVNQCKRNDSKEKMFLPLPYESKIVEVTPAVYDAVSRTRAFGEHRVETEKNIRDLLLLEKDLLDSKS
jgi:protein-tyrosine phosphatase